MRILSLVILAGALTFAQDRPAFEVASIKPNPEKLNVGLTLDTFPDGRIFAKNVTVFYLLRIVWMLGASQITGGPAWIREQGFDIQAQPAPNTGSVSRLQTVLMLGPLLEDRFKLKWHRESREVSAYALKIASRGSKLAPPRQARGKSVAGELDMPSVNISSLLLTLEPELDRPVVDQTGLSGSFSLHLTWASERMPGADPSLPSLFTALQEQLGLKLEPIKMPLEMFVIDGVELPSEN